jgi:hypothetical protein
MFDNIKDMAKRKKEYQEMRLKELHHMGEGCSKAGRKCSTGKHFDLVDLENLTFKNLFIDE